MFFLSFCLGLEPYFEVTNRVGRWGTPWAFSGSFELTRDLKIKSTYRASSIVDDILYAISRRRAIPFLVHRLPGSLIIKIRLALNLKIRGGASDLRVGVLLL